MQKLWRVRENPKTEISESKGDIITQYFLHLHAGFQFLCPFFSKENSQKTRIFVVCSSVECMHTLYASCDIR